MANKLIINPKKINYERITDLTDNNRKKTKKFINDDNYINIYEGLVNKDITRKNFKSNKNHTKTHGNSTNTNSDTKNTAGSTDTSSKIFLVGATSQTANAQTYSDNQVYATNG